MAARVTYLVDEQRGASLPVSVYSSLRKYLSSIGNYVKSSAVNPILSNVNDEEFGEYFGRYKGIDKAVVGALVDMRGIMLALLSYVVSSIRGGGRAGASFPLLMGSASLGKTYILTDRDSPLVRLLEAARVYVRTIVPRNNELEGPKLPSNDMVNLFGSEVYKVAKVLPGYFEGVREAIAQRGDVVVVMDELLNASPSFIDELIRWTTDARVYRVSFVASSNDPVTRGNVADVLRSESFNTLLSRMAVINFDFIGNHPAYEAMKDDMYDPNAFVYILFPEEVLNKFGLEVEKDSGSLVFRRKKFLGENKAAVEGFLDECVRVARKYMILQFIEEVASDEDLLDEVRSDKEVLSADYYYLQEVIKKLVGERWERVEAYKKDERILKVIEEGRSVTELVGKLDNLLDDVLVKREDLRGEIALDYNGVLKTVFDAAMIEFRRRYPDFYRYLRNVVKEEWNTFLREEYKKEGIAEGAAIDDLPTPNYLEMNAMLMKAKRNLSTRDSVRGFLRKFPEGMAILFKDKFSDSRLIDAYIKALMVMLYLSGDYYMDSPEVRAGVEFLSRTTFGPLGNEIFNAVRNYITAQRLDIRQRSLEELRKDFRDNVSLVACVSGMLNEAATFNEVDYISIGLRYVENVMKELKVEDVEGVYSRILEKTREVLDEMSQNEKVENLEKFLESVRERLKADADFMRMLLDLEGKVRETAAYRKLNGLSEDLIKVACAERLVVLEGRKIEKRYSGGGLTEDGIEAREVKSVVDFKPRLSTTYFETEITGAYENYIEGFLGKGYDSAIDTALEVAIATVIANYRDLSKRFREGQKSKSVGAVFLNAALHGSRYIMDSSSHEIWNEDVAHISPVIAALLGGEKFEQFKDGRKRVYSDDMRMKVASPLVAVMSCYVPFKKLNNSKYANQLNSLNDEAQVLEFYKEKVEELRKLGEETIGGGEKVRSKKVRLWVAKRVGDEVKITPQEVVR